MMKPEQDGTLAEANHTETPAEADLLTRMKHSWRVTERPFTSNMPVVGPLIVFIRERWNRVAAKWYVLRLLEQQNRFNSLVVELAETQARQADLISDRGLSIATLAEGVSRLSVRVAELEERTASTSPGVADEGDAFGALREDVREATRDDRA